MLGDIPELLLGAILQDSSYSTPTVRAVFDAHFKPFFERYCIGPISHSNHPKSQFIVHMATLGCGGWAIERHDGDSAGGEKDGGAGADGGQQQYQTTRTSGV